MAFSESLISILTLFTFIAIITLAYNSTLAVGLRGSGERFVEGRTEIRDLKSNKEVQELGRYSVEEYNCQHRQKNRASLSRLLLLLFKEVVEAESQVVVGANIISRYMPIRVRVGLRRCSTPLFLLSDGVPSKKSINFAPSTN